VQQKPILGQGRAVAEPLPAESSVPPPVAETVPTAEPTEIGGRDGLDPTRYGDWEKNGRCIDF
jgi:hypothetical protein